MAMQELGRISEVGNLRDIWPNEGYNFTPWLAEPENLDLLGRSLGLDLEFLKYEAPVGPYWLDILAKEAGARGRYVAIENQLESTDHGHLGQLLTYAAGWEAQLLIWIAPHFSDQHRAAIDWLNQWTQREIECYGVEIHVLQIGDSLPAPEFLPVAVPGNWAAGNARLRIPSRPTLLDAQRYREFFQPLVDELREAGFTDKTDAESAADQGFPSGLNVGGTYYAGFDSEGAWVYLWFLGGRGRRDLTNQVYDMLHQDRQHIESGLVGEWVWDRQSAYWYFSVSLWVDGSINDPPGRLNEIRSWMLETLPKIKEIFNPRLERILANFE